MSIKNLIKSVKGSLFWKRVTAGYMVLLMLVTLMPSEGFVFRTKADDELSRLNSATVEEQGDTDDNRMEAQASEDLYADPEPASEEISEEAASEVSEEAASEASEDDSEAVEYRASETIDGVIITVEADAGVFPEGAVLSARPVSDAEEAAVTDAVDEAKNGNDTISSSYTFDIKIIDETGNEIEPDTSKGNVKVLFAMSEVSNANLDTNVWHVEGEGNDLSAEKLATSESGEIVTAETTGFSYYQVEFTYGEKQYVLPGDGSVALTDILAYVGITNKDGSAATNESITSATGSDDSLFTVENVDGIWTATAVTAFSSNESLVVTVDGVEYEIVVTDAAYGNYLVNSSDDASSLSSKVVHFNGYDWYIIADNSSSSNSGNVTLFAKEKLTTSIYNNDSNGNGSYKDSVVKGYLDGLTTNGAFSGRVANAIASTDLSDVGVNGAKLYLLNKEEAQNLPKDVRLGCNVHWWLRSDSKASLWLISDIGAFKADNFYNHTRGYFDGGVRPALKLNLSNVYFNNNTKTFIIIEPDAEYTQTKSFIYDGTEKTALTNIKNATVTSGTNKAKFSDTYTVKIKPNQNHAWKDTKTTEERTITWTINPKEVGLEWGESSFTYTGDSQCPTATATGVVSGDGCNVTVTGGQTDVGTYTATASGLSNTNYKLPSSKTKSFTINSCETDIKITVGDMIYTGEELKPVPVVTADDNGNKDVSLSSKDEYTSAYTNNVNVGTATVEVTDSNENGNYIIHENSQTFTVIPKSIDNDNKETADNNNVSLPQVVIADFPTVTYSGEEQTPAATINYKGKTLKEGTDYTLAYSDNVNAGTATVVITGRGNYEGTVTKTFTIDPLPITVAAENFLLTLGGTSYVYNGQPQTPEVTLTRGDGTEQEKLTLVDGTDYEITYKNSNTDGRAKTSNAYDSADKNAVDAGTITVRVTGKGNYTGDLEDTYTITKREAEVYGLAAIDKEYDGNNTIQLDSSNATLHNLVEGDEDYVSVSTSATGEAETAHVGTDIKVDIKDAELSGAYAGNYTLTSVNPVLVDITKRELTGSMVSLAYDSVIYDGTAKEPAVTLTDMVGGANILAASDCEITYTDNVSAGAATVTITATDAGNYSGNVTKTFTINKASVTLTVDNQTSAHGAEIVPLTYQITSGSINAADVAGLNIKLDTTANRKSDVGTYPITISYTENANYVITTANGTYTITKGSIDGNVNVTVKNETAVYDGNAHSATVAASGVSSSDVFTIYYSTVSAEDAKSKAESTEVSVREAAKVNPTFTDAGTYTVYAYVVSDSYEGGKNATAKVTILKAPLTVTANDRTVTYGDPVPVDTNTLDKVTITGLVSRDSNVTTDFAGTVNYTTSYKQFSDVGTYTIRPEIENAATDEVFKNYDITYAAGTLTVNKKELTADDFTWTPDPHTFVYDGTAKGLTATVNALNNDDVVVSAYEGNSNTNADGDPYTAAVDAIGGSKAGNYTYTSGTAACDYTITKATNSWVVVPAIQASIPEGAEYAPVGTPKYGNAVFTYYTDSAYTTKTTTEEIGGSAAAEGGQPTKVGTYYLKVTGTATDNYEAPAERRLSFEITTADANKLVIYVTGTAIGITENSITYGDAAPTYGYSFEAKDGTELTQDQRTEISTYLNENVVYSCNYNTANADTRKVGTYSVIPSLRDNPADSTGYEYVFKTGSFTVTQKPLTVTWPTDNEFTYTGSEITYSASLVGKAYDDDDVTIGGYVNDDTNKNAATAVGTYQAKVDTVAGLTGSAAANYQLDASSATEGEWKITKAVNEITGLSVSDWYYGETAIAPTATSKYGNVEFKYQSVDSNGIEEALWKVFGSEELPTEAGTYRVYAYVPAGDNYEAVTTDKENAPTFTIHPAEITITADNQSSAYGEDIVAPLTGTYTIVKGVLDDEEKTAFESHITYTTTAANTSPVGTYPITAGYTGNAKYLSVTSADGVYTITGKTAHIGEAAGDNGSITLTYDGKEHGINAPVIKDSTGAVIDPALYKVYYSRTELTANNYNSGLTVSPRYADADVHTVYYYIVSEGFEPVAGSATVTIEKAPLTVTAKDKEIGYNAEAANDGVTYDGLVNGETEDVLGGTLTYSYKAKTPEGTPTDNEYAAGSANGKAGEYAIIPSGLTSDNYEITYAYGTMTVKEGVLTSELFDAIPDQTYEADESGNGVAQEPAVTIKSASASYVSDADYTVTYENNISAGTAYAVLTPNADGNFAGSEPVKIPFTINKKAATITAEDQSSSYRTGMKELSYQVTGGSLNDAERTLLNIGVETSAMSTSDVGTYDINVTYTENPNYEITTVPGTYTITASSFMTVTATGVDVVYDGTEHRGSVVPKTGILPNPEVTVYYSTSELTADNYTAGTTAVPQYKDVTDTTVYYCAVSENYAPVCGSYTVRIAKATLTVTPKDVTNVTYGDPIAFTGYDKTETYLTYDGFVGEDGYETAVTGTPVFTTTYTQGSDVGDYEIAVSGLEAQNYVIVYKKGTLTVGKKEVTLEWKVDDGVSESNPAVAYTGKELAMPMKATSNDLYSGDEAKLNLTYTGDSGTDVNTYTAELIGITGEKAGNYIFTLPSNKTWEITKAPNTVSNVTITGWTEGQPAPTPYAEATYAAEGEPTYKYYTKNGEDYTETTTGTDDGQSGAAEVGGQPTKEGTYYVKAYVAETDNYEAAESEAYTMFTVNPANNAITTIYVIAKPKTITYGDAVPTDFEYELKKAVKNDATGGFDKADLESEITLATIAGDSAEVSYTTTYTQGKDVGTYNIVPNGLTANSGYEIIYEPGTLTVTPKEVTLTWDYSAPFEYNGKVRSVNASMTGLYGTDTLSVVYDTASVREATNVGDYTAKAASLSGAKAGNYTLASTAQTELSWKITKAATGEGANTITASITGWTYGDTPKNPSAEVKYGDAADVTYTYYTDAGCTQVTTSANSGAAAEGTRPVKAGIYYMTAYAAGSDNYEAVTSNAVSFTIAKRPVTIAASDITGSVGEALQELTYHTDVILDIDSNGTKDEVNVALSTTATNTSPAGTYPITVGEITGADAGNYTFTKVNGTYHIIKSDTPVSITVTPYSGTYDGEIHDGITIGGEDATAVTMYYSTTTPLTEANYATGTKVMPKFKDAGSYTVYYYAASDTKTGAGGDVTVTIHQKPVTMSVADMSIVYGDEVPASDTVTYSGVVDGESITGVTVDFDYTRYQPIGEYAITPSIPNVETVYPNYAITAVNGKLTVTKKPLTFSWSKDAFFYDENAHTITATPSNKAQAGDDVSVAAYEDNEQTAVGNYTAKVLTIEGGQAGNYYIKDSEPSNTHAWKIAAGSNSFTTALAINGWTYGDTPNAPVCASLYDAPSYTYYKDSACAEKTDAAVGAAEEGGVPVLPGTYYVKAYVPAGDGYEALVSEAVSFVIAKAKLIITPVEQYGAVGAELNELSYTVTGNVVGTDTVVPMLATTATATSNTGNYDITVTKVAVNGTEYGVNGTAVADNPLYEITVGTAMYHLAGYGVKVTLSDDSEEWTKTYDGHEYGLKAELTAADGNPTPEYTMYYSTKQYRASELTTALTRNQVSEDSPEIRDIGTLTVWFYAVGNSGDLLVYGNRTITIQPKSIADAVITLAAEGYAYTGNEITPEVTSVVLDGVTLVKDRDYTIRYENHTDVGDPASTNPPMVVIEGVGNYKDTASKAFAIYGSDSHYTTEPEVFAEDLVYKKDAQPLVIGGTTEDGTILYSTDYDGTNFAEAAWQEEVPTEVNAGPYKVSYYIKGKPGYNNTAPESLDVTIKKKDITVKALNMEKAYGTPNPAFKYTAEGMYEGDELTGELFCDADENSDLGEYPIEQGTLGTLENENYNIIEFEGATLTIVKRPPSIVTNPPTEVLPEKAVISAKVADYRESDGEVYFRYGTDKSNLESKLAAERSDDDEELYVAEITNITAGTVYYYQAYITYGETEAAVGEIMSFMYSDSNSDSELCVDVENETGNNTYVIITVEAGNDAIATSGIIEIEADASASTTFEGLADGEYNVVARTVDGSYTETRLITIKNGKAESVTFTILKGIISTVVDVKTEDTPKVAVNGLPNIITAEEEEDAKNGIKSIQVKLDVEKEDETSAEGADAIKALLPDTEELRLFLNICLYKTIKELDDAGNVVSVDEKNLGATNSVVLEIAVPFDTTAGNITVYKYHNMLASKLTKLGERAGESSYTDGTYYVGDGYVYIYASQFSTYAIAAEKHMEASSTEASSTEASSTEASSTEASSTEASSTEASSTEASSTEASSTETSTSHASTSDATTASAATEAAKTSPKTGDSMPIAVVIAFMLSAAGMMVFLDWKKKKNRV